MGLCTIIWISIVFEWVPCPYPESFYSYGLVLPFVMLWSSAASGFCGKIVAPLVLLQITLFHPSPSTLKLIHTLFFGQSSEFQLFYE
jgi:hypothetical protein